MGEIQKYPLRPAEGPGPNPPEALNELAEQVKQLAVDAARAGTGWLDGWRREKHARANEIQAKAVDIVARFQIEMQKHAAEHHAAQVAAANAHELEKARLEMELRKAKLQDLQVLLEAIERAKKIGIEIDVRVEKQVNEALAKAARDLK